MIFYIDARYKAECYILKFMKANLYILMLEFSLNVLSYFIYLFLQIMGKMETLYAEISDILDSMEDKTRFLGQESSDTTDLQNHVLEMKDLVKRERVDFIVSTEW